VLSEVGEDVDESVTHCARTFQCAPVPATGKKAASPAQQLVHPASDANGQPSHSLDQPHVVARLHEQVQVIVLNRKLHEAKAP
jgi:hypothetical protein